MPSFDDSLRRMRAMDPHGSAAIAVEAILRDMRGRSGLRHQWDCLDADIQREIQAAWTRAVASVTPDIWLGLDNSRVVRAEKIAQDRNTDPHRVTWTVDEVLSVALEMGLREMEKTVTTPAPGMETSTENPTKKKDT